MIFRLNLHIIIKLITFIRKNWITQVHVETISFYRSITCDDIGTLASSLTEHHWSIVCGFWSLTVLPRNNMRHSPRSSPLHSLLLVPRPTSPSTGGWDIGGDWCGKDLHTCNTNPFFSVRSARCMKEDAHHIPRSPLDGSTLGSGLNPFLAFISLLEGVIPYSDLDCRASHTNYWDEMGRPGLPNPIHCLHTLLVSESQPNFPPTLLLSPNSFWECDVTWYLPSIHAQNNQRTLHSFRTEPNSPSHLNESPGPRNIPLCIQSTQHPFTPKPNSPSHLNESPGPRNITPRVQSNKQGRLCQTSATPLFSPIVRIPLECSHVTPLKNCWLTSFYSPQFLDNISTSFSWLKSALSCIACIEVLRPATSSQVLWPWLPSSLVASADPVTTAHITFYFTALCP